MLLARAQEAGTVRKDVRLPEAMALFVGALRMAEHAEEDAVLTFRFNKRRLRSTGSLSAASA